MTSKTRLVTSLPAFLLIPLLALGLTACVLDRQVKDTEATSDGPTVYGRVSVSVDQVSTR
jgi:hypothetical protein